MSERTIWRISGADARKFLQDLVTNNVDGIDQGLVYAALLTPQGKYLADFFLAQDAEGILLDIDANIAPQVMQRLGMYKLRADVEIAETALHLHRGLGAAPNDGWADPRHPELGWRAYRAEPSEPAATDWPALYIAHSVPQTGVELHADSYILEMGFERLNGVDFRKGCYVGQEVTARMKHKTELRKGLAQVRLSGDAAPGTEIFAGEKPVGLLHSVAGERGLAYLRFDRAKGDMHAGDAQIFWDGDTSEQG
ncbi:MAG: folate-binding protein YgfZ [Rhodobacteraceae bacterium]|nr:folate-binding protein YgfZ [Paracoccaceae bacterium]